MPKSHSDETKRRARQLYEQRGATHASMQLGVPIRTIRYWAKSEHWQQRLAAVSAGTDLSSRQHLGWALRKRSLADGAGAAAAESPRRRSRR